MYGEYEYNVNTLPFSCFYKAQEISLGPETLLKTFNGFVGRKCKSFNMVPLKFKTLEKQQYQEDKIGNGLP
jgi:hypothetical protein